MALISTLILLPVAMALLLLFVRPNRLRAVMVVVAVVVLSAAAILLAVNYLFEPTVFKVTSPELLNWASLGIDLLCCAYIVWRGVCHKSLLAVLLAAVQAAAVLYYELVLAHGVHTSADLYVDQLSIIMALIIALIGGGVCVYALGYMRHHQQHLAHEKELAQQAVEKAGEGALASQQKQEGVLTPQQKRLYADRSPVFFATLFLFLGAMFALVFSNRLSWLLTAWELTTVCSFALIGFTRTKEATANALKAVKINLAGGLGFSVALLLLASLAAPIIELDKLIYAGASGYVALPVLLICFAGMTKAAQMPFQGWLLGAMVAPTPVSALLHSSTMVKAGVFIIIKLAPALGWNLPGLFVLLVGGLTFLCCSALAISQPNAKRVLAYSTVANLGLIICCAGVGTPEAVWAALFLLVFHAAAKALLFCCVGTAEHHLGSRDIERLDNIFVRLPWLAGFMAVGMLAMFIAPFGMLISKWAALVSMVQSGHLELLFVLAFGSALTFVFWAKWLGKVLAVGNTNEAYTGKISAFERWSLVVLLVILLALSLGLPLLSEYAVVPYLINSALQLPLGVWSLASNAVGNLVGSDNLLIMSLVLTALLVLLLVQTLRRNPLSSNDTVYLSGVGTDSASRSFSNALGKTSLANQRNWYLESTFGEVALGRISSWLVGLTMVLFIVFGVVMEVLPL